MYSHPEKSASGTADSWTQKLAQVRMLPDEEREGCSQVYRKCARLRSATSTKDGCICNTAPTGLELPRAVKASFNGDWLLRVPSVLLSRNVGE
eukprot:scaffold194140_cov35-Tisochrysis_lutea.AAC.4